MSIKVQCPNPACGRVFNVKEDLAGRKAKCPGCSSPLIIPTPDEGVFDFGSLAAGAEAANPFVELAAAPPPAKSPKKPTPDSGSRKPPTVPEPVPTATPASKVAAPPMPVAEVIAEVADESGPAVTVPAAGTTPTPPAAGPAPFPQAEPWFYRFLEGYGKVLMVLGILAAVVLLLISMLSAVSMYNLGAGVVMTALYAVGGLFGAAFFVLTIMLSVAFVLLSVDAGRNLREIRRLLTKDKSPE